MVRILRFAPIKYHGLDCLPFEALTLSSPERDEAKKRWKDNPDHTPSISVWNTSEVEPDQAYAVRICEAGGERPCSGWVVSMDSIYAIAEALSIEIKVLQEPVDRDECRALPGSYSHMGLQGLNVSRKSAARGRANAARERIAREFRLLSGKTFPR